MRLLNTGLDAVFHPRRIALVGASDQPGSVGELFWRNLSTFPGEVLPVNPSRTTVSGHRAFRRITDIDGGVDLAVIVVPAAAVPDTIRDAAAMGVPAAVVISGGFGETGPEGRQLQEEMLAVARAGGVRIVGPNCFGVQNCESGLNASLAVGAPPGGGTISLVTQSGAYGMALHSLGRDEQVRFSKVYAAGNKIDLSDSELLTYLATDDSSRTLCFFLESLPDGRAFVDAARSVSTHRPVIVCKTGRSSAGARAAQSHTAGMAGEHRVWSAALEQAGVVLARSGLEMMDAARALDGQPLPTGDRVGIVTNSGGTGVELVDLLADECLDVPSLSPVLQHALAADLPPHASAQNPVDITPVWQQFPALYPAVVERLARSGEVDAVVAVLLQRSATAEVASALADAVTSMRADGVAVPVYVCWVASHQARAEADPLRTAGVPCFEWPERTARALGHAARYAAARARLSATPTIPTATRSPARLQHASGWLDVTTAAASLEDHGVQCVRWRLCDDVADALAAARELGYPVVLKADHPDVVHKTDVQGVRLGLRDEIQVATAASDLLALIPGTRLLMQAQSSGVEVIVGGLRDPQFGPVVLVGMGGVDVERLDDVVLGLAPVDAGEAGRLLTRLRGYARLRGSRGRPPVDVDALSELVARVGDLMLAEPGVDELDLNPVFARPDGCLVADWRIHADPSS